MFSCCSHYLSVKIMKLLTVESRYSHLYCRVVMFARVVGKENVFLLQSLPECDDEAVDRRNPLLSSLL